MLSFSAVCVGLLGLSSVLSSCGAAKKQVLGFARNASGPPAKASKPKRSQVMPLEDDSQGSPQRQPTAGGPRSKHKATEDEAKDVAESAEKQEGKPYSRGRAMEQVQAMEDEAKREIAQSAKELEAERKQEEQLHRCPAVPPS